MKSTLVTLMTVLVASQAHAASWQWKWTPAAGETAPKVEICPLKYGKSWAYSFEQDDGGVAALTVSQPFFAKYQWNDAPPGVTGGTNRPFVGTAAVILAAVGGNEASLSFEQIAELKKRGWGIVNHSFWHSGVHWDPALMNTPEQNRRELFWSQTFFAEFINNGRGAIHMVYPNGDYNYGPFLKEFGLLSGSRTSGWSPRNLLDPKLNLLNYSRSYLDEGNWANSNDPMQEFPEKPQPGDFLIDFTHDLNGDPNSTNNKRWVTRLNTITEKWGPKGDNSMWVAPSDEVVAYYAASRDAKVNATSGSLTVDIPDQSPGSALTLKISGLKEKSLVKAPEGGTLYRQGDTAWLTTPIIGQLGSKPPTPRVHRIYQGEVKNMTWDKPVSIAGVFIKRTAKLTDGFQLKIDAITPDGITDNIATSDYTELDKSWGNKLYLVVPDRPTIPTKELRVTSDTGLTQMEVWAVAP